MALGLVAESRAASRTNEQHAGASDAASTWARQAAHAADLQARRAAIARTAAGLVAQERVGAAFEWALWARIVGGDDLTTLLIDAARAATGDRLALRRL